MRQAGHFQGSRDPLSSGFPRQLSQLVKVTKDGIPFANSTRARLSMAIPAISSTARLISSWGCRDSTLPTIPGATNVVVSSSRIYSSW